MYIHGEYRNAVGEVIEVHLLTGGDRTEDVVIGDESSGVFFTDDPVETESQTSDTCDVLLRTQARIRLLTRRHMGSRVRISYAPQRVLSIHLRLFSYIYGHTPHTYIYFFPYHYITKERAAYDCSSLFSKVS